MGDHSLIPLQNRLYLLCCLTSWNHINSSCTSSHIVYIVSDIRRLPKFISFNVYKLKRKFMMSSLFPFEKPTLIVNLKSYSWVFFLCMLHSSWGLSVFVIHWPQSFILPQSSSHSIIWSCPLHPWHTSKTEEESSWSSWIQYIYIYI